MNILSIYYIYYLCEFARGSARQRWPYMQKFKRLNNNKLNVIMEKNLQENFQYAALYLSLSEVKDNDNVSALCLESVLKTF